jgi:hypothetical protein
MTQEFSQDLKKAHFQTGVCQKFISQGPRKSQSPFTSGVIFTQIKHFFMPVANEMIINALGK